MSYDKFKDALVTVAGTLLLIMFNDMRGDIGEVVEDMKIREQAFQKVVQDMALTKQIVVRHDKALEGIQIIGGDRWTKTDHKEYADKIEEEFLRVWQRIDDIEHKMGVKK